MFDALGIGEEHLETGAADQAHKGSREELGTSEGAASLLVSQLGSE